MMYASAALCIILSRSVTATTAPIPHPWGRAYNGHVKAFSFSANTSGLDSSQTLAASSRYALIGFGWQSGWDGICSAVGRGEGWGAAAATHAHDFFDSNAVEGGSQSPQNVGSGNGTVLCAYRHAQIAQRIWAQSALAAGDPAAAEFWLRTGDTPCLSRQPWGTSDPFWNFSSAAALSYWLAHPVSEVISTAALDGGAVLLDAADATVCGTGAIALGACDISRFDNGVQAAAVVRMLSASAAALVAGNVIPILSLQNRLAASSEPVTLPGAPPPCSGFEDALVDTLAAAGTPWVRAYAHWPATETHPPVADIAAARVLNALLEADRGVAVALAAGAPRGR